MKIFKKALWILIPIIVIVFAVLLTPRKEDIRVYAEASCKQQNAECYWNNSQHDCCPGLSCNFWTHDHLGRDKYKCEPGPTSTPTLTPTRTPTPTRTLTPTRTPTPTVTPAWCNTGCHNSWIGDGECDSGCNVEACRYDGGDCTVPTATVTPTVQPTKEPEPTVTPEETPVPTEAPKAVTCDGVGNDANGHPCGWSPEVSPNTGTSQPVCSVALPVIPTFTYSRINPTTVRVLWNLDDTNTTHYSFNWGYFQDNLPYGALNIPKEAKMFDIGGLASGKTVWVEMGRWNGNECVVYSNRIDP